MRKLFVLMSYLFFITNIYSQETVMFRYKTQILPIMFEIKDNSTEIRKLIVEKDTFFTFQIHNNDRDVVANLSEIELVDLIIQTERLNNVSMVDLKSEIEYMERRYRINEELTVAYSIEKLTTKWYLIISKNVFMRIRDIDKFSIQLLEIKNKLDLLKNNK